MRGARLLQTLLLLQNRGRMTTAALSAALEVSRRTVLRDVDAMTEAGLPVIVHRGPGGGIELGFDYRTRLTGLDADEAEAIAVMLSLGHPALDDLGLAGAAARARAKIWEAFPDQTRQQMDRARVRFAAAPNGGPLPDPSRQALARAVREGRIVRCRVGSAQERIVHPTGLVVAPQGWALLDGLTGEAIAEADWGDLNISAHRFAAVGPGG
ncbi:MAG: HTH domain-containing protein [Paracoccaceae bacterium]